MRLFVAVDVGAIGEVEKIQNSLGGKAKPVGPQNLHITLHFLGNVPDAEKAKKELSTVSGFGSFEIELKGLGVFPERGAPKVLWIGAASPKLDELAWRVKKGFGDESPFSGHITIARLKAPCNLKNVVDKYSDHLFSKLRVEEIVLKESILMSEGSVYKILQKVKL